MRRKLLIALVGIAVVALIMVVLLRPPFRSTHFVISDADLRSTDATVQAQAALEQFFNALGSGDQSAAEDLSVPGRGPTAWAVSRLAVYGISPAGSDAPADGILVDGRPAVFRSFNATVRMWPGDGSTDPGELLQWTWWMERCSDGKWRLYDHGEG